MWLTLPTRSALGVLELLPRTRLPVLLSLAHARVAGQEPGLLERQPELVGGAHEGAREPVADRAGLPGGPPALDGDENVELPDRLRHRERLRDDHPECLAREVVLEGAMVHDDPTRAWLHPDACDRRLSPPRAVEAVDDRHHRSPAFRTRGASDSGSGPGCCAACGCSAPR